MPLENAPIDLSAYHKFLIDMERIGRYLEIPGLSENEKMIIARNAFKARGRSIPDKGLDGRQIKSFHDLWPHAIDDEAIKNAISKALVERWIALWQFNDATTDVDRLNHSSQHFFSLSTLIDFSIQALSDPDLRDQEIPDNIQVPILYYAHRPQETQKAIQQFSRKGALCPTGITNEAEINVQFVRDEKSKRVVVITAQDFYFMRQKGTQIGESLYFAMKLSGEIVSCEATQVSTLIASGEYRPLYTIKTQAAYPDPYPTIQYFKSDPNAADGLSETDANDREKIDLSPDLKGSFLITIIDHRPSLWSRLWSRSKPVLAKVLWPFEKIFQMMATVVLVVLNLLVWPVKKLFDHFWGRKLPSITIEPIEALEKKNLPPPPSVTFSTTPATTLPSTIKSPVAEPDDVNTKMEGPH